jgi:hypothetical protein
MTKRESGMTKRESGMAKRESGMTKRKSMDFSVNAKLCSIS